MSNLNSIEDVERWLWRANAANAVRPRPAQQHPFLMQMPSQLATQQPSTMSHASVVPVPGSSLSFPATQNLFNSYNHAAFGPSSSTLSPMRVDPQHQPCMYSNPLFSHTNTHPFSQPLNLFAPQTQDRSVQSVGVQQLMIWPTPSPMQPLLTHNNTANLLLSMSAHQHPSEQDNYPTAMHTTISGLLQGHSMQAPTTQATLRQSGAASIPQYTTILSVPITAPTASQRAHPEHTFTANEYSSVSFPMEPPLPQDELLQEESAASSRDGSVSRSPHASDHDSHSSTNKLQPVVLTREQLQSFFMTPLRDAASQLGISVTALKTQCRRVGIKKWPYRKVQSLKNKGLFAPGVEQLQAAVEQREKKNSLGERSAKFGLTISEEAGQTAGDQQEEAKDANRQGGANSISRLLN